MSTTPSPSPTRITTEAHLAALGEDSVIRDRMGDVGIVKNGRVWFPETAELTFRYVAKHALPADVVWSPAAPSVSDTAAATITPADATALVAKLRGLIESFVDPDDCWFDHHGGCQAHGYLSLGYDKQQCPHAEAKEWLESTAALGLTVTDKADQ